MPSFDGAVSATKPMPSFEGGASATTTMSSFEGGASSTKPMPSFEGAVSATKTMSSFEGGASATTTMPSFEGGASAKGYRRHNPRACKKKVRGGVGSRRLFNKKAPRVSTPVSAGLTRTSEGSLPCITPVPMKRHDIILQLKRKVKDMESQATKWNDRLIELEVSVKQKDSVIDKHLKRSKLMNDAISNDKKAHNLVS
jgi:hypothetical protein